MVKGEGSMYKSLQCVKPPVLLVYTLLKGSLLAVLTSLITTDPVFAWQYFWLPLITSNNVQDLISPEK